MIAMKYGVYIIESLRSTDEYFDGESLHAILNIALIPSKYNWVDTKLDFINELEKFKKSNFRYLHLSFHGDMDGIVINGEFISNVELANILAPVVKKKRVFMSSCKGSNRNLAGRLIIESKCQSLVGTPVNLDFDKAALFWPSFYHVNNMMDSARMNQKIISGTIKKCVDLFRISINYYHFVPNRPYGQIRRIKFRYDRPTESRIIKPIIN